VANGVSQTPQQIGVFGTDWQVDGIGDFNGNGSQDILLEHDVGATRDLFIATIANNSISSVNELGLLGDNVQIDGIGNFAGDRTSDIAFHYDQSGLRTIGYLQIENGTIVGTHISGVTGLSGVVS
jgi:hypothetical protein